MTYESATNNQSNGLTADLDSIDAVARVEAVLVTSERPVREARLVEATGLGVADVRAAIASLNDTYEDSNRVFRITAVADGWQVLTLPEVAPVLARLLAAQQQARLSQAAMETLSIIAYRQPVLRAEIEAIRGVACGEVLRGLLERRLIRIAGRALNTHFKQALAIAAFAALFPFDLPFPVVILGAGGLGLAIARVQP